jgi:exodeoxyribonuclease VII small subunit
MAKNSTSTSSSASAQAEIPPAEAGPAALPASYEEALRELEALLDGLESGDLPLEQLLLSYKRGSQLLTYCRGKLEAVENQIKVLEVNELKPWIRK